MNRIQTLSRVSRCILCGSPKAVLSASFGVAVLHSAHFVLGCFGYMRAALPLKVSVQQRFGSGRCRRMLDDFWLRCVAALLFSAGEGYILAAASSEHLLHSFSDFTFGRFDKFGSAVALDGDFALVGAPGDSFIYQGSAALYDVTTGRMVRVLRDPDGSSLNGFGSRVSIDGDHALISQPTGSSLGEVHLFSASTGDLLLTLRDPTPGFLDGFGFSITIDGNFAVVGESGADIDGTNSGQAHVFDVSNGDLLHTLVAPTPSESEVFGHSVAMDEGKILIGAPGENAGRAHLFDSATGELLRSFDEPTPTGSDRLGWDRFGSAVAVSGRLALIGAENHGAGESSAFGQAHLFDIDTGKLLHTFNSPSPRRSDVFGRSVALDGNLVLIGEPLDDTQGENVGRAYLFDALTGQLLQTFDDPDVARYDRFGSSVALDNGRALIGSSVDTTRLGGPTNTGQAHLFAVVPEPPNLQIFIGIAFFGITRRRCFRGCSSDT